MPQSLGYSYCLRYLLHFNSIHHDHAPQQILERLATCWTCWCYQFRARPHIPSSWTSPEQMPWCLGYQSALFTNVVLYHRSLHQINLCWKKITACSPYKMPYFMWEGKAPNILPETLVWTIIRGGSIIARAQQPYSNCICITHAELSIWGFCPNQLVCK